MEEKPRKCKVCLTWSLRQFPTDSFRLRHIPTKSEFRLAFFLRTTSDIYFPTGGIFLQGIFSYKAPTRLFSGKSYIPPPPSLVQNFKVCEHGGKSEVYCPSWKKREESVGAPISKYSILVPRAHRIGNQKLGRN